MFPPWGSWACGQVFGRGWYHWSTAAALLWGSGACWKRQVTRLDLGQCICPFPRLSSLSASWVPWHEQLFLHSVLLPCHPAVEPADYGLTMWAKIWPSVRFGGRYCVPEMRKCLRCSFSLQSSCLWYWHANHTRSDPLSKTVTMVLCDLYKSERLRYSSVTQCLPAMCKALNWIPSMGEEGGKKKPQLASSPLCSNLSHYEHVGEWDNLDQEAQLSLHTQASWLDGPHCKCLRLIAIKHLTR